MFVIWRGFGWLLPVIVVGFFLGGAQAIDSVFYKGYYRDNDWPNLLTGLLTTVSIAALGYLLNYKNKVTYINGKSGKKHTPTAHSFFFIPIEYWAIIVPTLLVF